jgi:hypothetical protein
MDRLDRLDRWIDWIDELIKKLMIRREEKRRG